MKIGKLFQSIIDYSSQPTTNTKLEKDTEIVIAGDGYSQKVTLD